MRWRPLAIVAVLGLLAVGCAKPPTTVVGFGVGKEFVPQVADAQDDVGHFPQVAVASDGTPYVGYLGFPDQVAKGQVALPRPIGAPSVPAVMLTNVANGIWTRGAVAMQAEIANVQVPFGPAIVPQVKSMTPENVNGTALAIDGRGGVHVAWVSDTGVWYGDNPGAAMPGMTGSFSAERIVKAKISQAGPIGQPSIAVDASGAPWVAFTRTTAVGQDVVVATRSGGSWTQDVVATVALKRGGGQPGRTGIALLGDGTPVVVWTTDVTVEAAAGTRGGGWSRTTITLGGAPTGVSLAPGANGGIVASYYIGDEVAVSTSANGRTWQRATVASVGTGQNEAGRSTGVGVDGSGATYVTWYDPGTDDVHLATATGSSFSPVQTSDTTGGDQPSLAVAKDGTVYVAWFDQPDRDLILATYGEASGIELAIQSPTPTGAAAPSPSGGQQCTQAQNGALTVTAQQTAFDTSCIEIPAGQKVTIHFDNKDAGTTHNIAVYPSSTQLSNPLFRGDPVTGPNTTDYSVGSLKAGEYYFQCDFHPTTMNGTFKVVAAGGGKTGGGGGGKTGGGGAVTVTTKVIATNLAFDTNQITLAAGKPTTLTFDNQDAGVQHNIAIYKSSSDLTTPLFRGAAVTGPNTTTYQIPALDPGTYYFQCDFHPTTMNGTVVVK